jgi:hypothetical protein
MPQPHVLEARQVIDTGKALCARLQLPCNLCRKAQASIERLLLCEENPQKERRSVCSVHKNLP